MNSNTQLNENYKFKLAYVAEFIKDMFSVSKEAEDINVKNRIEQVKQQQDTQYVQKLEKDVETHEVSRKRKSTRNSAKENIIKEAVKESSSLENNEVILDEEKDRERE